MITESDPGRHASFVLTEDEFSDLPPIDRTQPQRVRAMACLAAMLSILPFVFPATLHLSLLLVGLAAATVAKGFNALRRRAYLIKLRDGGMLREMYLTGMNPIRIYAFAIRESDRLLVPLLWVPGALAAGALVDYYLHPVSLPHRIIFGLAYAIICVGLTNRLGILHGKQQAVFLSQRWIISTSQSEFIAACTKEAMGAGVSMLPLILIGQPVLGRRLAIVVVLCSVTTLTILLVTYHGCPVNFSPIHDFSMSPVGIYCVALQNDLKQRGFMRRLGAISASEAVPLEPRQDHLFADHGRLSPR